MLVSITSSTFHSQFIPREGEAPVEPLHCQLGRSLALPLEPLQVFCSRARLPRPASSLCTPWRTAHGMCLLLLACYNGVSSLSTHKPTKRNVELHGCTELVETLSLNCPLP